MPKVRKDRSSKAGKRIRIYKGLGKLSSHPEYSTYPGTSP
jgi:hypothetical protein